MTIYKKLQKRQMVSGTQGPCVIVWKNVIDSDPHCHGLPPRTLHPHLGPRTPTQGPGVLLMAPDPYLDLVPSLGAQDPPFGTSLSAQELYLGPGNLTQGLGPPFRAQDPHLEPRTLIQGAKLTLIAQHPDTGPMTCLAPKFLTQD